MRLVTIADFRAIGVCKDARHWFKRHNLDWRDFVLNGITVESLRATNDQQDNLRKIEAIIEAEQN